LNNGLVLFGVFCLKFMGFFGDRDSDM